MLSAFVTEGCDVQPRKKLPARVEGGCLSPLMP